MRVSLVAVLLVALSLPATAETASPAPPTTFQPLKGDGFTAPSILQSSFDGDHLRVAYVPAAASNAVGAALVAAMPAPEAQELSFTHDGRTLRYSLVGDLSKPPRMILLYLHGLGDSRAQGMDETRFGYAFARLKRLAVANDALYIAPDFSGFGRRAEREVAALIADYAGRFPGVPVLVACLSAGGRVCWRLAENADAVPALRGVLLLGAGTDRGFIREAASSRLRIYIGVGTKDGLARWRSQDAFFRAVKAAAPDFPIRLTIFDGGEHATAMRLTDWVTTLNWMLAGKESP